MQLRVRDSEEALERQRAVLVGLQCDDRPTAAAFALFRTLEDAQVTHSLLLGEQLKTAASDELRTHPSLRCGAS